MSFWVSCAFCDALPYAIVWLCGTVHGEPLRIERAACPECIAALMTAPLPAQLGDGMDLLSVELAIPMFSDLVVWTVDDP